VQDCLTFNKIKSSSGSQFWDVAHIGAAAFWAQFAARGAVQNSNNTAVSGATSVGDIGLCSLLYTIPLIELWSSCSVWA
jgi:hypothetical protein